MKFDFKSLLAAEKQKVAARKVTLNAIIMAPPGGGKSSVIGTTGLKTLYIYSNSEDHGPVTATHFATGDVSTICIDDGKTADEALEFLNAILTNKEVTDQFDVIALDSASSIERIIRGSTEFRTRCLSSSNKHNSFAESGAVSAMFDVIIKNLKSSGKHTILTLALDAKEIDPESGEVLEAMPKLTTYDAAASVLMQFSDRFIVGKLTKGDKSAYRIQFSTVVSKASKDAAGRTKKLLNINLQLTGVSKLPESLPANLADVIKLKAGEGK